VPNPTSDATCINIGDLVHARIRLLTLTCGYGAFSALEVHGALAWERELMSRRARCAHLQV
jgi:hypothetical protein